VQHTAVISDFMLFSSQLSSGLRLDGIHHGPEPAPRLHGMRSG
jgi:hypothetical protein